MADRFDRHIQALRDALMAEHNEHIAEVQQQVDAAAARGDEWYRKWHQDDLDRLKAMRWPWETEEQRAERESRERSEQTTGG